MIIPRTHSGNSVFEALLAVLNHATTATVGVTDGRREQDAGASRREGWFVLIEVDTRLIEIDIRLIEVDMG